MNDDTLIELFGAHGVKLKKIADGHFSSTSPYDNLQRSYIGLSFEYGGFFPILSIGSASMNPLTRTAVKLPVVSNFVYWARMKLGIATSYVRVQ